MDEVPKSPFYPDPVFSFDPKLQEMTYGKQLLYDELPFSHDVLHLHHENGLLKYRYGIESSRGRKPTCLRCGNHDPAWFSAYPCARCGKKECLYCRKCLMMGRISSCTRLVSWSGPSPAMLLPQTADKPVLEGDNPSREGFSVIPSRLLAWSGKLSEGQQKASEEVVQCVERKSELLIWAVCGAGKTEILFAGIERALTLGQRVCIATPRTDVVLELTPRLKAAFPTTPIASLYGGSPDRHKLARLTITTTHQLLRFYHAFDTLIVDEVDAFPYSVDESLQYAVKQARKPQSALLYLTATPNQKWQKECFSGKKAFVTIPARFHRHPLPVPEFIWCGNWEKVIKKMKLPKVVSRWIIARLVAKKQVLLFVPKIELLEVILPIVLDEVGGAGGGASPGAGEGAGAGVAISEFTVETVHSEDPLRKEKVQRMRNRETFILLTTTILERGVTFPNIDVAVLGAEDRIFTESALVQIAGRVGRSADFPQGNITFFHFGKTKAMVKARRQILKMNEEAKHRGLIN